MEAAQVTAVIPTHNRAAFVGDAVQSLLDQTASPESYRVLVVDNASSDGTRDLLQGRFGGYPRFTYVFEPVPGLSNAKNRALRECATPAIAYMDDDATAAREWVATVLAAFDSLPADVACVGGRVVARWELPPPPWLPAEGRAMLSEIDFGEQPHYVTDGEYLGGGNSAFRAEALREAGGFSVHLGRRGKSLLSNEEILLRRQLAGRGYRYYYAPAMSILHFVPKERLTRKWLIRRAFWQGVSQQITRLALGDVVTEREASWRWRAWALRAGALHFLRIARAWRSEDPEVFGLSLMRAQQVGDWFARAGFIKPGSYD